MVGNIAKVAVPIVISVIALVFSILSYFDQHAVYTAAAVASEKSYATRVSYWLQGTSSSHRIIIQNRSIAPISNVTVAFSLQALPLPKEVLKPRWRLALEERIVRLPQTQAVIQIGTIPPCSIATTGAVAQARHEGARRLGLTNLTSREKAWIKTNVAIDTEVEAVDFTDANGVSWQRNYHDILTNISTPPTDIGAISYTSQNLNVKAANGCS